MNNTCQFIIGKVQLAAAMWTICTAYLLGWLCQSLIGKVHQPFSSASIHILFFFSHIIKLFHSFLSCILIL